MIEWLNAAVEWLMADKVITNNQWLASQFLVMVVLVLGIGLVLMGKYKSCPFSREVRDKCKQDNERGK